MQVVLRHFWVLEKYASTTIGLKSLLVRIDDKAIYMFEARKFRYGVFPEVFQQGEVPTVGGICMYSEVVRLLKSKNLGKWIHCAQTSGTHRTDYRSNRSGFQL